ncbi:MAG: DUF192 domain-containing protein [Bacteriovoracaceae bacterium]
MFPFITQHSLKLIKKFGIILILSTGCLGFDGDDARSRIEDLNKGQIILPSGETLQVFVAYSPQEQRNGLSGVKNEQFSNDEGMLFPATKMMPRQFWMPNTHFNLDIVFLTGDFYVLDIHRDLEHYPEAEPKGKAPLSKKVFSQHVLEVKSSSPLAKEIQPGMTLKWSSDSPLLRTK